MVKYTAISQWYVDTVTFYGYSIRTGRGILRNAHINVFFLGKSRSVLFFSGEIIREETKLWKTRCECTVYRNGSDCRYKYSKYITNKLDDGIANYSEVITFKGTKMENDMNNSEPLIVL